MAITRTADEWREIAVEAVLSFVEDEGAFVWPELEAKLADRKWAHYPTIQPHHLSSAGQRLVREGAIERAMEPTRGGGRIATFTGPGPTKGARRVAARKRLLHSRYLSWTKRSSDWDPAPIGSALERVVFRSLLEASPYGYRLLNPAGGEVRKLFNERIPGGPIDSVAVHSALDPYGRPGESTFVLVEAKNLRGWIYPSTQELFQLLDKAASLQNAHPEARFSPVLVCRRLNPITGSFARHVGFHVIETQVQYVRPVVQDDVDARRKFDEVDNELSYALMPNENAVPPMVRQFRDTLPGRLDDVANRWSKFAAHPDVPDLLAAMRDDELPRKKRREGLNELASIAEDVHEEEARWGDADTPF